MVGCGGVVGGVWQCGWCGVVSVVGCGGGVAW